MSPDADMGVTGNFGKRTLDKDIYFVDTVNVASDKLQKLKEYARIRCCSV
ncbi:MAG: hypothetical protein ACLPY5_03885 [Candidatus Bathyarchaeia archaeon]